MTYKYSIIRREWFSWYHTAIYIAYNGMVRTELILDTDCMEYICQVLHMFSVLSYGKAIRKKFAINKLNLSHEICIVFVLSLILTGIFVCTFICLSVHQSLIPPVCLVHEQTIMLNHLKLGSWNPKRLITSCNVICYTCIIRFHLGFMMTIIGGRKEWN